MNENAVIVFSTFAKILLMRSTSLNLESRQTRRSLIAILISKTLNFFSSYMTVSAFSRALALEKTEFDSGQFVRLHPYEYDQSIFVFIGYHRYPMASAM